MHKKTTKMISFMLGLIVVLCLFSGCKSDADKSSEEPVVFTYALSTEPDTLDPSVWFTTSPLNLNVYQPLLQVNTESEDEPYKYVIAESYTVSDDGLSYIFKIRENMTFHDGTPVNAEAVKFSVQRTIDIGGSPAGIWSCVDHMNVLSEYEIEFVLNAPVPFDSIVAAGYGSFIMSPTAVTDHEENDDLAQAWMTDNSCGTGPWKLSEWTRGERMVFVRNEDYYGGWEENQPDMVVVKFVSEYATSRLMLENGEADMVDFVPSDQIEELSKTEGISCEVYPSYETLYLQFNHEKAPTDNVQVRQALSYAFNYDGVTKITNNTSKPMKGILPSSLWGWDENAFQYTFDLDKARKLLDEAGYKDKELVLDCYYSAEDDVLRQVIEMYKSDLASINVTLNVEAAPFSTIASKQREFDTSANIFTRYWWCDYVDPNDYIYYLVSSEANYKITYFKDEKIDKMIAEAHEIAGVDREKAIEIYQKINDYVIEEANSIFAFEKDVVVPMRTWVEGFKYNAAYPRIVEFYNIKINK
ncbi:MAG: ABC transporter substrate-binding protein [Clostridiaceae bacterium]